MSSLGDKFLKVMVLALASRRIVFYGTGTTSKFEVRVAPKLEEMGFMWRLVFLKFLQSLFLMFLHQVHCT
jgi:hypothetical protein